MDLQDIINFFSSAEGSMVLGGLLLISEALASISKVQSNSIFQLVLSLLQKLAKKPVAVVALVVMAGTAIAFGCSGSKQERIDKVREVAVKVSRDLRTAVVTGCQNREAVEVAVDAVQGYLPSDTSAKADAYIKIADAMAGPLCDKVLSGGQ